MVQVVEFAMHRDLTKRYTTGRELASDLAQTAAQPLGHRRLRGTDRVVEELTLDWTVEEDGEYAVTGSMWEMFELRMVQTDPNFANYQYQSATGQVVLLDFGATRNYKAGFVNGYKRLAKAAILILVNSQSGYHSFSQSTFKTSFEKLSIQEGRC